MDFSMYSPQTNWLSDQYVQYVSITYRKFFSFFGLNLACGTLGNGFKKANSGYRTNSGYGFHSFLTFCAELPNCSTSSIYFLGSAIVLM